MLLGIVGCGQVVERGYLPALSGLGAVQLRAVADPVAERRRIAAGAAGYDDLGQMLASEPLDAVLVCSPDELHLEHAADCAEKGVPVLVEKPPAPTLEQAQQLAALRPEPWVGFNRRFAWGLPIGSHAAEHASRITAIFDAPSGDWDHRGRRRDPLLDLGCHLIDLGCWITGQRPTRARAFAGQPDRPSFEVELAGGARLLGDCGAADTYRELLELRTADGQVARWRWPESNVRRMYRRLARQPSALIESWRQQVRAFAGAVRGARPDGLASAGEALDVMGVLDAIQTSAAADGRWITLEFEHPPR